MTEPKNILAIECAVERGSVTVLNGTEVRASSADRQINPSRAEEILAAVGSVMVEGGLRLDQLDLIAVSTGPGSYSGIRIGIATALGLKNSLRIPCVGVPVLSAMARSAERLTNAICAIPMGKKDVAWQLFKCNNGQAEPTEAPEVASASEFAMFVRDHAELELYSHSEVSERLTGLDCGSIRVIDVGARLADVIGRAAAHGQGEDRLVPLYVRNKTHRTGF